MQTRREAKDVEKIRQLLRKYARNQIEYNEPHFTLKLDRLQIDRREVLKNIRNPSKLVFVGTSDSKNPNYDYVHDLYFRLSKNRVFKVPASLKPKSLYLITIFKIRRRMQHEANKYYQE